MSGHDAPMHDVIAPHAALHPDPASSRRAGPLGAQRIAMFRALSLT
jgi:hypothetical protein